ncbi:MAG: hypothetical protein HZB25_03055 [Candidatus Eisenbacteria bacterium]|nr:hypothetical protein [Candidatus Eisenbacteria bacterium]
MTRTRWIFAAVALTILTTGGLGGAPECRSKPNAVVDLGVTPANGGFEQADGGRPANWVVDSKVLAKGTLTLDRNHRRSGSFSLKLEPNSANVPGPQPLAVGQVLPAARFRGQKLHLSAWLAASAPASCVVGLVPLDGPNSGRPLASFTHTSRDSRFVLKEATFELPAGDTGESLVLFCAVDGTAGTAWFDDVSIEVQGASPAAPPTVTVAAPLLQADIAIDARSDIRVIPRTLYGINAEWMQEFAGAWDAKTNAANPEIQRLTRELGVSLIRSPGAGFSDYYHWKNGIGPQASRPTTEQYPGGPNSRHTYGTEEALSLAKGAGAHLLVTVNAGTGTPDEAAEWVRYVNPPGRTPADRRVDWWEVGNELYMKGDGKGLASASMPPEKYADRFLAYARAMRKADPTLKIGAIGGENYGRYQFISYPNWNRTLLTRAGDEMDFLAVHNAYAPVLMGVPDPDPVDAYRAMLAAPALIARNLADVAAQISKYAPRRASRISIAVTEWGALFHVDPKSPMVDHVKTLASALYDASVMNVFLQNPKVEVANFFKLSDYSFMGSIGRRKGGWAPTAPYLALQLYTRHFGDVLVGARTTSPTFDTPGMGAVDRVRGVPYLDVVASRTTDGRGLFLMAVNRHLDRPIRAKIRINDFVPRPDAVAWTLNGTGPDANTGTELGTSVPVPGLVWARQSEAQPWRRFNRGAPGEVQVARSDVNGVANSFEYTFPAHSVTSLEIRSLR